MKTKLPCRQYSKKNFYWVRFGLDNNKTLRKKYIEITGFSKCHCKLVSFPSIFKFSFYFQKVVITRSYTECLMVWFTEKNRKLELQSVDPYSKELHRILKDWQVNVYLYG